MSLESLRERFLRLFAQPADVAFDGLVARYGEVTRAYHTLDHIADCLAELDASPPIAEARAVELAIWWHDAVYEVASSENERRSAELAERDLALLGEPSELRYEVGRLILLTAGHAVAEGDDAGARLVGIDLSVLGRSAEAYDAYAAAIRQEYAQVPDALYRPGRARILQGFLEGPIYADPYFAQRYEAQARANLQREIALLSE